MNTKVLAITLTGIMGLATMTTAQADMWETFIINQVISKIDSNRNGQLDLAELQGRWNTVFNQHDAGSDKQLSYTEFEAMLQSQRAQARGLTSDNLPAPAALFAKLDTNKNRFVSHAEYMSQRVKGFQTIDSNRDNTLTKAELKSAKGKLQNLR